MALYKWIQWLYFHGLGGSTTMEYSFVARMWPTHTILSQLGKRKNPLYKGFCFLLVSKILTFRELNISLFKAHSVIFASYTRA
uniref:hypothetical protein n=1 Tax=Holdemanella biformis TaxID=1735 RepID=UPI00265DFCB3